MDSERATLNQFHRELQLLSWDSLGGTASACLEILFIEVELDLSGVQARMLPAALLQRFRQRFRATQEHTHYRPTNPKDRVINNRKNKETLQLERRQKEFVGCAVLCCYKANSQLCISQATHLGWAAATAENSLRHIGLPKDVFCLSPVTISVDLSKLSAAWLT